jgi:hypothetical protein
LVVRLVRLCHLGADEVGQNNSIHVGRGARSWRIRQIVILLTWSAPRRPGVAAKGHFEREVMKGKAMELLLPRIKDLVLIDA